MLYQKFDSNLKVLPPLRSEKTRLAFIDSIINGTIDAISSDHTPIEIERKKCEFQKADFGIIGLETVFPIINTVLKNKIELTKIIELISSKPRKILNKACPKIDLNETANITLFDPEKEWTYTEEIIASKSKNSPFIGHKFIGKALGIINNSQILLNN